jgi:predicted nucleotidyltransferase component of viral defense system
MHWPDKPSNEHYRKLYQFQDEVLTFIDHCGLLFYLGGGTALSRFYYNHRYSDDLDFFTLEGVDFIQNVQELHKQLEDKGYHVSTYGFSQNFARFSITGSSKFPGLELKVDFIRPRENSHIGDFKSESLFSRIDNPRNILTEKLSYIYKKIPKDIADIWVICRNLSFHWEEVIAEAARKRTTDPLFTAEILSQFPSHELDKVSWITPIRVEDFERDRETIVKNIITKEYNQLADEI